MQTRPRRLLVTLPLAAILGASATFAFAPYSLWPLTIISLSSLLLLIHQAKPKRAFLLGWTWGLGFFGLGLSWVHVSIDTFGGVPPIVSTFLLTLLSSYLALFPATFAFLVTKLTSLTTRKALLIVPFLWLVTEALRGWLFTGFPWLWLGYSQIDSPLASFAPIAGVEFLNALVALLATSLAGVAVSRKWSYAAPILIVIVLAVILKPIHWVEPKPNSDTKLAIVQGNIAQDKKWLPSERWPTLEKYVRLTEQHPEADIVIWPEAAIPAFEYELPRFFELMDSQAKQNHNALITGVLNREDRTTFYNSILVLGENGKEAYQRDIDSLYHKHHLLPFGEFVPFEDWLRPLAPIFNLPNSAFTRGNYLQDNLVANHRHLLAALCYEIIFGEQLRENLNENTDFILTLSNDAWFGTSVGPLQHMEIARMRALELGKPLIRSTNNGITAVTDEKGKIVAQLPQFETQVLTTTIQATQGTTPYARWGVLPLYLLMFIVALFGVIRQRQTLRANR